VRIVNKKKPPGAIPLSALIPSKGFQRNYDIEFKTALDTELHGNAAANIRRKNTLREQARLAREAKGRETYLAIKAIMDRYQERHGEIAKPREVWPDVQRAIGGTERNFRKVRLKILDDDLKQSK
jgi:hypothetical protein